jgi:hypothetical protein
MNGQHKGYVKEHAEEVIGYQKDYWKENRTNLLERKAEYYVENKDEIKERKAEYYLLNSKYVKKKVKEYCTNNKEKVKVQKQKYFKSPEGKISKAKDKHRRRAANKQTECTLTAKQWKLIVERQGNKCNGYPTGSCNVVFTNENAPRRDHIIPVTKNGKFTFENTQALCNSCNCRKHNNLDYTNIVTWITPREES